VLSVNFEEVGMRASLVLIVAALSLLFLVACDGGSGSNNNTIVDAPPVEPPVEPPIEPPFVSPADNAVTVDGNVWLQPADFTGYIFEQVDAVCPDPAGVCSGSLQGSTFDLTGYKWASIEEVSGLFNSYGVSPPFTAPFQERLHPSKEPFIEDFAVTAVKCYGDCPVDIYYVAGLVRDPAPSGVLPYDPYATFSMEEPESPDIYFNNTSKDENEGEPFDTSERGVWLWKPAILGIVVVDGKEWLQPDLFTNLSWNDINAVCPEGACAGTLNGQDLTGWTWATVDDLNALFNYYIGTEVLGPGPDIYVVSPDSEWAPAFFNDGWRGTGVKDSVRGWVRSLGEFGAYTPSMSNDYTPLDDTVDIAITNDSDGVELRRDFVGGWFYRTP
jgi:hypothetical protein